MGLKVCINKRTKEVMRLKLWSVRWKSYRLICIGWSDLYLMLGNLIWSRIFIEFIFNSIVVNFWHRAHDASLKVFNMATGRGRGLSKKCRRKIFRRSFSWKVVSVSFCAFLRFNPFGYSLDSARLFNGTSVSPSPIRTKFQS